MKTGPITDWFIPPLLGDIGAFHVITSLVGGLFLGAIAYGYWIKRQNHRRFVQLQASIKLLLDGEQNSGQLDTGDLASAISESILEFRNAQLSANQQSLDHIRRLDSVLNDMVAGVIVLDDQKTVIYSNQPAMDLLSIDQDSLLGRSILEIVRIPVLDASITECLNTRQTVESEFETNRVPRRNLALRVSSMVSETKGTTMLVLSDVTNLRQLENMRKDFVANVSHELKTPLASIKAYAETLRMGGLEDQENRMEFVATIEEQANRLHQLIIDLIQLSRIEQGKTAYQITDVDLCSLLHERVMVFSRDAQAASIQLDFDLPDDEIFARVDDEGMQTIIDNLISNAIRYTPANGRITAECKVENGEAVVQISDNGIGIAPEQQERIFERFYRVDKARSREVGGTGLGLSIVKHLTQSFGGSVSLTSTIGRGSTFRVSVPLSRIASNSTTNPGP